MSSTAPVQDVAEVLIRSEVEGKPVELCLWFRAVAPPITFLTLTTLVTRVSNAWRFNFVNVLGGPHLYKGVIGIDRTAGSTLIAADVVNLSRGFGGPSCTTSIALGLLNLTDEDVNGHYSRSHIYAIPTAKVAGNFVDVAYANQLLSLWSTNNQSHGPFGWHHVYVSLYVGGAPRAVGVSYRVTHYAIDSLVVAPMRYRLLDRPG